MRLPIFRPQPKERHLLIIELGHDTSRAAYFHDDEGELIFGGTGNGANPEAAYAAIPNKPSKITPVLLGLPFCGIPDASTVVRYRRSSPQTKVSEDEIKNALSRIPPLTGEPFFEDLFNAKVDGRRTSEPIERMGDLVELNYYQATADQEVLSAAREHVKNLGVEPGIVPTAYAIAKLISQTTPNGALTLNISPHHTEVSLTADGHLVGIKSFDLGGDQKEYFLPALEAALEELSYTDLWPETIYLCGTIANYEEFRSLLLTYPWTKKVNMMAFPEISVFHPLSVNLTLPAEVGLNALSLLG